MRSHHATAGLVVVMLFALSATVSAQETRIGGAQSTRNKVEGTVNGKTGDIVTGTSVYSNEVVSTGDAGVANLVFLDNSNLSVGPTSEVRLDKFVYDPSGSTGSVVIEATKGAFRFVAGSQDKRAYQIKTPFGTLGIRG